MPLFELVCDASEDIVTGFGIRLVVAGLGKALAQFGSALASTSLNSIHFCLKRLFRICDVFDDGNRGRAGR